MTAQFLYYGIILQLVLVLSFIYIYRWRKNFDINISMIFTFILVASLAYTIMYYHTPDTGISSVGVKLSYLGGCYLPFYALLCVSNLCHINIHRFVRVLLFFLSTLLFSSTLTIGYYPLFYTKFEAVKVDGVVIFIKEYSSVRNVYTSICCNNNTLAQYSNC